MRWTAPHAPPGVRHGNGCRLRLRGGLVPHLVAHLVDGGVSPAVDEVQAVARRAREERGGGRDAAGSKPARVDVGAEGEHEERPAGLVARDLFEIARGGGRRGRAREARDARRATRTRVDAGATKRGLAGDARDANIASTPRARVWETANPRAARQLEEFEPRCRFSERRSSSSRSDPSMLVDLTPPSAAP